MEERRGMRAADVLPQFQVGRRMFFCPEAQATARLRKIATIDLQNSYT
jgi:hypothetical protein